MKLKFKKIITHTFDTDKERQRIKDIFEGVEQEHMLHALKLFEQQKFTECQDYLDSLGDAAEDYPEIEHVGSGMLELLGMAVSHEMRKEETGQFTPENRKVFIDYSTEHFFEVSKENKR